VIADVRVEFLVAAHNRRDLTVRAITGALASAQAAGVTAHATLFDDGSTDGTPEAVTAASGDAVEILRGDGSAFWARSMAATERRALERKGIQAPTVLVWLNDDVSLDLDALPRLLTVHRENRQRILVGSMRDPESGETTYGGMRRNGRHPLAFALVEPGAEPIAVAAMNGNLVLVPAATARVLGGIDGEFSHSLADIDYATRSAREGTPVMLAPGTFGTCPRNTVHSARGLREEWSAFTSTKGGGNSRSTARILRRLAPATWWLWWTATYVVWWARRARRPGRPGRPEHPG